MVWARLDDSYPHHPKMLAAGLEALGFDAAGLCYSARFGTDGFIADSMLPAVYPGARNPRKLAERLVDVGRWHRDDNRGGWVIHDYLEYNPPAEKVAEIRKARAEAGRKGGKQSGKQRRKRTTGKQSSKREASASGGASRSDEAKTNPVPVPVPVPLVPVSPDGDTGPPREAFASAQTLLAEHIDAHPRPPPKRVTGHLAREIKLLVDDGWTADEIRAGLSVIRERGLHPSTLASCVNDAANAPPSRASPNGQRFTATEQKRARTLQAIQRSTGGQP